MHKSSLDAYSLSSLRRTQEQCSASRESGRSLSSNLKLDFNDEAYVAMGDNLEYDEVDLLSECSTPVEYTPGKYLQLCNISSQEVTIWPVSLGLASPDTETASLMSYSEQDKLLQTQTPSGRHRSKSWRSPQVFLPIGICVVVALTALGFLATVL